MVKKVKLSVFIMALAFNIYGDNFPYLWSSYTTYFKQDIDDRGNNIQIAANYLDGYILLPKTIFSFNEDVTSKIPEQNLGVACVLINDKRVLGYGGGLCQVSSTLYAASLYAGLSIYERKPHSKIVSYIPAGFDATVSKDDGVDLKIYNPYRCKLLIRATVRENGLTISIYGTKPKLRDVRVFTTKPEKIGNFFHTTTVREVFSSGRMVFSEVVSRDIYMVSE
ncbi:MAG: VanW family protein [Candidatus Omnitrophica bacterium]|nr:VanW family protein [Candidatus Omnitrophota bacterium]